MAEIPEYVQLRAKRQLAKRHLYDFCCLMFPKFYQKDRTYLKDMCYKIENFIMNSDKHFLIINAPPRHGKSITAQCASAWLFGRNPEYRIMTGSYNERLASIFSRNVRNMIQTVKIGDNIVYSDIFPETRVKFGEASAQMWSIDGQSQVSYLATSPNGSSTGFGCECLFCDDLIRSAEEAYNENALEDTYSWFINTMLSRLEGKRKCIIIMTRWAEKDLAGRIINAFKDDLELITYKAQNDDGTMLCDSILDAKSYEFLKQEMNEDILQANYNQKPIDIGGRLYNDFKVWEERPDGVIKNYTDTADTGSDFLCSIDYIVYENEAYITDLVFTDEAMETTERAVADLYFRDNVSEATIESNNGGRGFARNVERLLKETHNTNKTIISTKAQTHNKESRILASSAWVQNHVYMPFGWKNRFPKFYQQVMSYQRKGKNAHDDSVDVLAAIYEDITDNRRVQIFTNDDYNGQDRIYQLLN